MKARFYLFILLFVIGCGTFEAGIEPPTPNLLTATLSPFASAKTSPTREPSSLTALERLVGSIKDLQRAE